MRSLEQFLMSRKAHHVVFLHPDLGIGGAERLVIDAAVALQNHGHTVTIFTSHCDPTHCFDEARDGTLDVRVRGNTIVPVTILGRLSILCAILRQAHLILQIALLSDELQSLNPSIFFVDQLSAGVPLLRILSSRARILFYCHFPDKLLSTKVNRLKNIYRIPFDWLENWSTGCSDGIVVNSKFTRSVFEKAFPSLKHRQPAVIYPCVDITPSSLQEANRDERYWPDDAVILSINRYERKKDVGLALRAFAQLSVDQRCTSRLVIAGGYDLRVVENVAYHRELCDLADSFKLKHATSKSIITALAVPPDVRLIFLLSVPNTVKQKLLASARLLVYTPRNEHLGIVPLEAMLAGVPVLAADEGGPTETVVDGQTGWLRNVAEVDQWANVVRSVVDGSISAKSLAQMGTEGQLRVRQMFSKEKLGNDLDEQMTLIANSPRPSIFTTELVIVVASAFAVLLVGLCFT